MIKKNVFEDYKSIERNNFFIGSKVRCEKTQGHENLIKIQSESGPPRKG